MNVDVEAIQRRIAEFEQRAVMLAARQHSSVRQKFNDLLATLAKTSRVLLRVVDNAQIEKEAD